MFSRNLSLSRLPTVTRRPRQKKSAAFVPEGGARQRETFLIVLLEQLHRVDECLDHSQGEWNTDEQPRERELPRRCALLLGVISHDLSSLCAGRFTRRTDGDLRHFGFVIGSHVEAVVNSLDQGVADKPDHQEPGHDVHGDVIGVGLRHAVSETL